MAVTKPAESDEAPVPGLLEHKSVSHALLAVKGELPKLTRTATNPHFKSKYVPLEGLMETVEPILLRHGLLWMTFPTFAPVANELLPALGYEMLHVRSATVREGKLLLLAAKDDPQGQSAAITYARRYSLEAILGLTATDDDDGNRASEAARGARGRQEDNRPMSPEELQRMLDAIGASGLDLMEVLTIVGIDSIDKTTIEQGRRVKGVLERAKTEVVS